MDRATRPRAEPLTVAHRFVDGVGVIRVAGSMVAETSEPVVTTLVHQLLEEGCRRFVLNLTEVPSCDTRGLAALVLALNQIEERDGSLRLAQVQPRVHTVLETTGLLAVFQVSDTEREALTDVTVS